MAYDSSSSYSIDAFTDSNSVGPGHEENQDSFLADAKKGLFAVADGVGGYEGGKVASELAVEELRRQAEFLIDAASVENCLLSIHRQILERSERLGFEGMGTTIAVAKVLGGGEAAGSARRIITANVGDSPILLVKSTGEVGEAFEDDSERSSDPSNLWSMVQYLGVDQKIDVHRRTVDCEKGDALVLCSDGITDNLPLRRRGRRLLVADVVTEKRSAKALVEAAMRARLKSDDMTAVLVFFL